MEGTTGLELYLQTPCCGAVLFARNPDMIDVIEELVGRTQDRSHCQWLPKWVLLGRNREDVLKALGRLREMVRIATS